jgi:hypothetical protein
MHGWPYFPLLRYSSQNEKVSVTPLFSFYTTKMNEHLGVPQAILLIMSTPSCGFYGILLIDTTPCLRQDSNPRPSDWESEARGEWRKQFCLLLPHAMDFKVSCSQIPSRAFAGIRTHDPLSGWENVGHDAPYELYSRRQPGSFCASTLFFISGPTQSNEYPLLATRTADSSRKTECRHMFN